MRDIKEEIAGKLIEIEKKEKVQILYAVESGSRAWGVASPDSVFLRILMRNAAEDLKLC